MTEPEQPTRSVRVMWDYMERPPLWVDYVPDTLGLSGPLIESLNAWADQVEATADTMRLRGRRQRRTRQNDHERMLELDQLGRALAVQVKAALGDDWHVTYWGPAEGSVEEAIEAAPMPPPRYRHDARHRHK